MKCKIALLNKACFKEGVLLSASASNTLGSWPSWQGCRTGTEKKEAGQGQGGGAGGGPGQRRAQVGGRGGLGAGEPLSNPLRSHRPLAILIFPPPSRGACLLPSL